MLRTSPWSRLSVNRHPYALLIQRRHIAGPLSRIAARILRLRYLIFGAGVGGTYAITQKYENFKSSMPDFSSLFDHEEVGNIWNSLKESLHDANEIRKARYEDWKLKLANINKLTEQNESSSSATSSSVPAVKANADNSDGDKTEKHSRQLTVDELQQALFKNEIEYNRRIEELLQENRTLRSELLLRLQRPSHRGRIKKSLIDMYSEVLDELSDLDSAYNAHDQLPRVVVVGDQSAGKTSVLEMIAQARIFPRGSGEMMTRSPVQVTLSEGPYHVASFKDSPREYDLTKEPELAALRKDIEMRMKVLVSGGKTISSEVISLNVKGPGLQRMVLIDLPGIISTVTTGMASGTKETIQNMARHYMGNPNAIILCVQDGSIDAERSNVTDLVSSVDPLGKRTIFVLTKVDLAEANLYNPNRIKQILEGQLFPMKALGYFAVVTGKGSKDESIESIKEYEEEFFRKSRLFREGTLRLSQMTTANLSKAVSERFWKMVKDTVEQQADMYRAFRYNLETEWKNSFSHLREMDREELFEKARNEILDDLITLNGISAATWEKQLRDQLWVDLQDHIFQELFEPAQQLDDLGAYQTNIDIWLRDWVEKSLPSNAVQTGWRTLYMQLDDKLLAVKRGPHNDPIFDSLKHAVHQDSRSRHLWDRKAEGRLRVIQSNALDDRTVHEKSQWSTAVEFLEKALSSRLQLVNRTISDLCGPSRVRQFLHWQSRSPEQSLRREVISEIETLLSCYTKPSLEITADDLTTIRRNLQARNTTVSDAMINELWTPLVRRVYLERSIDNCYECRKSFYYYQQGFLSSSPSSASSAWSATSDSVVAQSASTDSPDGQSATDFHHSPTTDLSESGGVGEFSDCREVILFYRLMRMLEATSNSLRQQIMNDEARRLEHHVKQVLSEMANDPITLRKLLTGRRVALAEELKRVRHLQDRLEEFIAALNKDE